MLRTILFRVLQAIPTLLGVSIIVFLIVRMTGDPAAVLLPPEATRQAVKEFRHDNGLDLPLPLQFLYFLRNAVIGDLGTSLRYNTPVTGLISDRLGATVQLTAGAVVFATVVGLLLGVLGGLRPRRAVDHVGRTLAVIGQAVPTFFLGIVLILLFGVQLRWLPTIGAGDFRNLILPSITLGLFLLPIVLRVTRGSVRDVAQQDYIRTARAKGISERRVVGVHVLKGSLIPVVTVIGLQIGTALSGAVVTEVVFAWPGVGQLLVSSVTSRDFPVVQGVVLFAATVFVAVNLIVDLSYSLLDPRIRLS